MFQGLERTEAIEDHISKRLAKVDEFIKTEETPKNVDVHIKKDASVKIELMLTSKNFHLDAHSTDYDLYLAADQAIEKLLIQIKKQKAKLRDMRHDSGLKRVIQGGNEVMIDPDDIEFDD